MHNSDEMSSIITQLRFTFDTQYMVYCTECPLYNFDCNDVHGCPSKQSVSQYKLKKTLTQKGNKRAKTT